MTLPAHMYRDPCEVAIRNEAQFTCAACVCHQKNRELNEYECIFGVEGYPEHTNKTCEKWVKRGKRKHSKTA